MSWNKTSGCPTDSFENLHSWHGSEKKKTKTKKPLADGCTAPPDPSLWARTWEWGGQTGETPRQRTPATTSPILYKNNNNNKKTLCDFLKSFYFFPISAAKYSEEKPTPFIFHRCTVWDANRAGSPSIPVPGTHHPASPPKDRGGVR